MNSDSHTKILTPNLTQITEICGKTKQMSDLNQIGQLEQEAIYLASMKASKHDIQATITEMIVLTKRYLGEVNSYNFSETDINWGKTKD